MRLGLLADIHEDVASLRAALDRFGREGVDRIVFLGDVVEHGSRLDDAVALLGAAGAVGVWGNHDVGLCRDPHPEVRARFRTETMAYLATLRPRLELEGCLFSHVEPWLDPEDVSQLWYFGGPPHTPEDLARSFAAFRQPVAFLGHFHRWMIATPEGPIGWDGNSPIRLDPEGRYLVVLGATGDGRCGVFDTETRLLTPIDLRDGD